MQNWKSLTNFIGLYEISDHGNIRSVARYVNTGIKHSDQRFIKSKPLKPTKNQDGYLCVTLRNGEYKITKLVHRLVAIEFLLNPENHKIINHKDFNILNNHVSNLEWCSTQYNTAYSVNANRHPYGENHLNSIFTELDIREIRKLRDSGMSMNRIGKLYNTSRANIRSIVNRLTWRRVI